MIYQTMWLVSTFGSCQATAFPVLGQAQKWKLGFFSSLGLTQKWKLRTRFQFWAVSTSGPVEPWPYQLFLWEMLWMNWHSRLPCCPFDMFILYMHDLVLSCCFRNNRGYNYEVSLMQINWKFDWTSRFLWSDMQILVKHGPWNQVWFLLLRANRLKLLGFFFKLTSATIVIKNSPFEFSFTSFPTKCGKKPFTVIYCYRAKLKLYNNQCPHV